MACQESMVEQCRRVKAVDPTTRCFVYRNTELALHWLSSQRAVMDAAHAEFFLRFQSTGNTTAAAKCAAAGPCDKVGRGEFCCPFADIYCENQWFAGANRSSELGQFFWDFTNPALREWWLANFFPLDTGAAAAARVVDGLWSDDSVGLPQEHAQAVARMGYTAQQVQALQDATQRTWQQAMDQLVARGGYDWQMFGNHWLSAPPPNRTDCAPRMRQLCAPAQQHWPMLMNAGGGNTTLAAFLITRPPHGFIGYSVEDSRPPACPGRVSADDPQPWQCWDPLFDLDVGQPLGLCREESPGVFARAWSRGTARLDCNTFAATLDFRLKKK